MKRFNPKDFDLSPQTGRLKYIAIYLDGEMWMPVFNEVALEVVLENLERAKVDKCRIELVYVNKRIIKDEKNQTVLL